MEAKETVMNPELARDLATYEEMALLGQSDLISELVGVIQRRTAEAQAEISFKAGEDKAQTKINKLERHLILTKAESDGYGSELLEVQKDCISAKKEGRKEVMEWISETHPGDNILLDIWQAKLKEWGIE